MQHLVKSYEIFNDFFQHTNGNILTIFQDMHPPNELNATHVKMETPQKFLKKSSLQTPLSFNGRTTP